MGAVKLQLWARNCALATGLTLIGMGVIGCFYPYSELGVYTIVSGVFVLLFEWPVPGVTKLGAFNENFWVRGILYIFVAGPSFAQAASFGGACFLCVTALLYLIAAYRGESWVDPKAGEGTARRGKGGVVTADRGRPPSRPATRARPSEMEWQMSPLASDSQVDSQGYLIGKPAPRNANGAAY